MRLFRNECYSFCEHEWGFLLFSSKNFLCGGMAGNLECNFGGLGRMLAVYMNVTVLNV